MRHLIVCCDGTWNTPDQRQDGVLKPTNVVRLYNALAETDGEGNEQKTYYHPGVGSEGSWLRKKAGGGFGLGLTKNIMSAYHWLGRNYQAGDKISLFGFSRGAYTVRSLSGLMGSCGLLDLSKLTDEESWAMVKDAEKTYRKNRKPGKAWFSSRKFHNPDDPTGLKIHLLGVWDTVGALGIPNDLALLDLVEKIFKFKFRFHHTDPGSNAVHARHAVAIDEKRAPFSPTLWTGVNDKENVKQVWFPGVHSDVGGGYLETGLSDGALKWMMTEAIHPDIGIKFKDDMFNQIEPDHKGPLHDSFTGGMKKLKSRPRSIPLLAEVSQDILHESVLLRNTFPPISEGRYRDTVELAPGQYHELSVYAHDPWNETGVYLHSSLEYEFTAQGEWVDWKIACGPNGIKLWKKPFRTLPHLAGSLWGKVEKFWKKWKKNEEADFKFTRRQEDLPWFSLVGAVGDGFVTPKGITVPHSRIDIGDHCRYRPKASGYLFCYANDAWHFYGNNKGSVRLKITCSRAE